MINYDPVLVFECLLYINVFHYAMFATCDTIMTIAKNAGGIPTPNIEQDAGVVIVKLLAELIKIIIFNKYKEKRKRTMIAIACLFNFITIGTLVYAFFFQHPHIKLEIILNSLTALLEVTEIFFGIWCMMPAKKKYDF